MRSNNLIPSTPFSCPHYLPTYLHPLPLSTLPLPLRGDAGKRKETEAFFTRSLAYCEHYFAPLGPHARMATSSSSDKPYLNPNPNPNPNPNASASASARALDSRVITLPPMYWIESDEPGWNFIQVWFAWLASTLSIVKA